MTHLLRRSLVVLLVIAGAGTFVMPAFGQSSAPMGEFSHSPAAQQRGQSVQITGKCVNGGSTDEKLLVTVRQGADGNGAYQFPPKLFPAAPNGTISGTIEVPGDAPFGDYLISGSCRTANNPPYFTKIGPFAVVERASDVTTTTAPPPPPPPPARATTTVVAEATTTTTPTPSTTSTTVNEATTTTPDIEVFVPEDDDATPSTTIDEFAGTRNEDDDDSIGPLLIIIGVVPLVLAIAAIAFALARRRNPAP